MSADVAAIVAGLTKAGVIILKRMRPGYSHEAYYLRSAKDVWAPAATLRALAKKGLVEVSEQAFTRYTLTDAGLSVRAALQQNDEG